MAIIVLTLLLLVPADLIPQGPEKKKGLDERVSAFLEKRRGTWRDLNVPASDGKILYDLIVRNNYKGE